MSLGIAVATCVVVIGARSLSIFQLPSLVRAFRDVDYREATMSIRMSFAMIVALMTAGCAATADFKDQSLAYNVVAGEANDRQILLNVIRSSFREAPQFTTVQSVTGTNNLMGNVGLSSPLTLSPVTRTGMGGASGSVTTSVTNAVLDTGEFYSGMRSAIPASVLNDYFQEGYFYPFLFSLFFERVVLWSEEAGCKSKPHDLSCQVVFRNNPCNRREFALFQSVMRYLLRLGFTTETVKYIYKPDVKPSDRLPDTAQFCFRPHTADDEKLVVGAAAVCDPVGIRYVKDIQVEPQAALGIRLDGEAKQALRQLIGTGSASNKPPQERADDDGRSTFLDKQNGVVHVGLRVRAPLAAIEFLGDVVSAYRKDGEVRTLPDGDLPWTPGRMCDEQVVTEHCPAIFLARTDLVDPSGVSVTFNGLTYSVPGDPTQAGLTYYAMSIVKQLVALSTSAKDLPAPSVLTIAP